MADGKTRKHSTFNLDVSIKNKFKAEVAENGGEMSETIESLMIGYVNTSRKLRDKKNKTDGE